MRGADEPEEMVQVLPGEPQVLERHERARLVQQAHHHPFAERGRQGGDTDVDVAVGDADLDAAVLGQPLFGDVHARHDLDARDEFALHVPGRRIHVVEDAVHPLADLHPVLVRLDVHIAGAVAHRLAEHQVDQLDHRRVAGVVEQVGGLLDLREDRLRVILVHVLHHLVGHFLTGHVVGRVDGHEDLLLRRQHGANALPVEPSLQVVGLLEVGRLGHGQVRVLGRGHRDHLELLQEADGHAGHEERVNAGRQPVHDLQAALLAARREQVALADPALGNEDIAEPATLVLLHRQRSLQVLGPEPAGGREYLPQRPDHRADSRRRRCTAPIIPPPIRTSMPSGLTRRSPAGCRGFPGRPRAAGPPARRPPRFFPVRGPAPAGRDARPPPFCLRAR